MNLPRHPCHVLPFLSRGRLILPEKQDSSRPEESSGLERRDGYFDGLMGRPPDPSKMQDPLYSGGYQAGRDATSKQ